MALSLLFNLELKETMVSITWNRMELIHFLNWRTNWSGMTRYQLHGIRCSWWTTSIGGAIDLEWHYPFWFNWESKEI